MSKQPAKASAKRPLSPTQRADATRLRAHWDLARREHKFTQEQVAADFGWKQQSSVSQYLNAKIPLNTDALLKFAAHLNVHPSDISPSLATALGQWREKSTGIAEPEAIYGGALARVTRPDELRIPQLNVEASMGDGAFPVDHVETVRNLSVSVSELRKQCTFSSPNNLAFITGYGDSMEPTYRDGDLLLVDRGIDSHTIDGVHVLVLNGQLYIKTLQRNPDSSVWMISDNKKYQPYLITAKDEVQIQGRVVLAWNARRL